MKRCMVILSCFICLSYECLPNLFNRPNTFPISPSSPVCVGCPVSVNGNWGDWSFWGSWSDCSVSCGGGNRKRRRERQCNNPKPSNGGKQCNGENREEDAELCSTNVCPGEDQECKFIRDCQEKWSCKYVADTSCACNFGKCVFWGGYYGNAPKECVSYEDCPCKCVTEKWECHDSSDCIKFEKCSSGNCSCYGNVCEHQCNSVEDCKDDYCNRWGAGYKCKCENFLCGLEKVTIETASVEEGECRTIQDCWNKDKPCQCKYEECVRPWWFEGDGRNCRKDQDCETIKDCHGSKCSCNNIRSLRSSNLIFNNSNLKQSYSHFSRGKCEKILSYGGVMPGHILPYEILPQRDTQ